MGPALSSDKKKMPIMYVLLISRYPFMLHWTNRIWVDHNILKYAILKCVMYKIIKGMARQVKQYFNLATRLSRVASCIAIYK